jgi:hypothetical protein
MVGPAARCEQPRRRRAILPQRRACAVADPQERRGRPERHLPILAEDRPHQRLAVERQDQRPAHVGVGQDGMGPGAVAPGALIEQEEPERRRRNRDQADVRVGRDALQVGERRGHVVHRVGLAREEQVQPGVSIGGGADDHPVDPRPAQEERGVGRELDELAGYPAHPPVGTVADRMLEEGRPCQPVGRQLGQQVGRKRRHVPGGVVELLGVGMGKADDHPMIAVGLDRGDVLGEGRELGRDGGVTRPGEREQHVASGHRRAVVPAGAGIELEHQGHRVAAAPAPRQHRDEAAIAGGDEAGAKIGQPQEEVIGHLEVGHLILGTLHQGRNRHGGLTAGDDHDAARRPLSRSRRGRQEGEQQECRGRGRRTSHRGSGSGDAGGWNGM